MSLSARFNLSLRAELTGSGDLGTPTAPVVLEQQILLASGTGASQADKIFADNRSLAASATEDLDLAGGALLDPLGAAFSPAKIKGVIIKAAAANPGALTFGGDLNAVPLFGATNDVISIPAGGEFSLIWPGTGVTVTAGTGDILQVAAAATAGTYTYDIVILGTSA